MSRFSLDEVLGGGDALIIMPPFAGLTRPSLAAHVLQACARAAGFRVDVLYANMLLASVIGEAAHEAISYSTTAQLLGERFFARAAYGPTSRDDPGDHHCDQAGTWADRVAQAIARHDYRVVGCTTSFQQTAGSIALLKRIKQSRPDVTTIIGGANCEGEMAEGIVSIDSGVDFVFSGECESAFPRFLEAGPEGFEVGGRIIRGEPCRDLDAIPLTDFSEYYRQLELFLPASTIVRDHQAWILYESSRGCWWGEKHHCTFCGLNALSMSHRQKSPDRVIADLNELLRSHPGGKVSMVDNIMPHGYFRTLLPRLARELSGQHIFYEQKSNLSLDQVILLREAGVAIIQPGIEALSTPLLKLMDKGVTARQNLALLRYARAVDMEVNWNLLYDFPGEEIAAYRETLALLPLMRHLTPPSGAVKVSIERFSPYFDSPERYGVTNLRPLPSYGEVLPPWADPSKVAYHFEADFPSASLEDPAVIRAIHEEVEGWKWSWKLPHVAPPVLSVTRLDDDTYLLLDTRGLRGTKAIRFLDREAALLVLTGSSLDRSDEAAWALEAKLLATLDGRLIPLATAAPALLREFESQRRAKPVGPLTVIEV